ncbi:MAG: hypothetical protein E7D48_04035 [Bifidobacterium scardovii]|jgi:hypothetical protein|uniref:hypothetical protein n=1 Tax=Bifidobacterium scardovii TaxID=158787 RepID=UPI002064C4EC|nr:hypothetical protein [Bifidobacterium scardovii]MDU2421271.1 hypothetical protein [Bifidobacterium scardovii]DAZ29434.1 MAG TPA: hypothetical protein [Caudoviricetes sp.]
MTDKTSLEERLAGELAARLFGSTPDDTDGTANVTDAVEDSLKACGMHLHDNDTGATKGAVFTVPAADAEAFGRMLEDAFKNSTPFGRILDPDTAPDPGVDTDDDGLGELEHMRDVADTAYTALSDLAMHCHRHRNETAWKQADEAAGNAHRIANAITSRIERMEDED